eukprot:TRINITY_DN6210_c0_g1_i2.p1 TRINITY_DN6210_c0_g1~~TRINITY_DN6210_c0_g1_i2.p1  ORF type:complete len:364 (+),score=48.16 TRINITY_DN6210_c0_g1_i2:90-1181(+)
MAAALQACSNVIPPASSSRAQGSPDSAHATRLTLRVSASTAPQFDDMFDFEDAKGCKAVSFDVEDSAQLVLQDDEVGAIKVSDPRLPSDAVPLLQVVRKGDSFWVKPSSARRLWKVVHRLAGGDQCLAEGDLLKLGRVKFRVHQLGQSESTLKVPSRDERAKTGAAVQAPPEDTDCCRICLEEGACEENGPLVKACKCTGSVACVHAGCLRTWISTRLGLHDDVSSFVYRQTSCELCKTPYPMKVDDEPLVELPTMSSPFVALDVSDRRQSAVHVLPMNGDHPHGIGRTNVCAVRVYEASISRCHATIRHTSDGEFMLADNNSKFGTLLAVRRPIRLDVDSFNSFQVGNTVVTLSLVATPQDA